MHVKSAPVFYTKVFWDWEAWGVILLKGIRSFLFLYPSNHHYRTPKLQKGNPLWEALSLLDITSDEILSFSLLFCPFTLDLPHIFLHESLISRDDFNQLPESRICYFSGEGTMQVVSDRGGDIFHILNQSTKCTKMCFSTTGYAKLFKFEYMFAYQIHHLSQMNS